MEILRKFYLKFDISRFGNIRFGSVLALLRANGKYNVKLRHLTRRCQISSN